MAVAASTGRSSEASRTVSSERRPVRCSRSAALGDRIRIRVLVSRPPLHSLFAPQSVAVIGASRDPSKVGGSVLANLRSGGFEGRVIPINPQASTVQGLVAAKSLLAVDDPVDLAVVTVPAVDVLPALEECVIKGVPAAVVISAGFRESGPEGQRRERELRGWLRENPIRVLGPNCLGWIRPARRLNVTFALG